jgi:catechol 2,3-dioxygenase-like lactoylglutathione lyase family enzyme
MFRKLDCVCIHTADINASFAFYREMGLQESWRLDRTTEGGVSWTLIGLKFPDVASSELVISSHPDRRFTEVEIRVDDVRLAYQALKKNPAIKWIAEPFEIENGHVAVMTAPDGNDFVLIGA